MKRFKTRKKVRFFKVFIFLIIILISFIFTIKYIKSNLSIDKYIKSLFNEGFNNQLESNKVVFNPISILFNNLDINFINNEKTIKYIEQVNISNDNPIVYLYNTHDLEEYKIDYKYDYSIIPTVKLASYIMQEKLNSLSINTIVETNSIKDILNKNNWIYKDSYKASKILLLDAINNNKSLKYFIDIHRDSSSYDKTTINYDNKNYAQVMFIIGMENNNYEYNLNVASKLSELLNNKVKGLSKGILKKEGIGVNGIYNQDVNNNVILIELGGVDNNISEVVNTINILSEVLSLYIKDDINEQKEI